MKKIFLFAFALLITISSCKDLKTDESGNTETISKEFTGVVANNPEIEGHLNIMGYFVDPMISGNLSKDGSVKLKLPKDFDQITQKAFDTYNNAGDGAFALEAMNLEDLFVNVDSIIEKGKSARLSLAGKYYGYEVFDTDTLKVGTIYPTTSLEYLDNIKYPDQPNGVVGHHYMLLHSDAPVIIEGTIQIDSYINDNIEQAFLLEEIYDINMQPGWNIIKYEIKSFVTDDSGNHAIQHVEISSTDDYKVNEWQFLPVE